jgi:AcrR family transcriptional regulator
MSLTGYNGQSQMKAQRKDTQETRVQLLQAAEVLFARHGVDNVTLLQIGREAGQKNRNAAQYHFADKPNLINALLDRHSHLIAEDRRSMLDELEERGDPTIRELVDALVLPIVRHVENAENGLEYLLINRQLISSLEYVVMERELAAPVSKSVMKAKSMILQSMLFHALGSYYADSPRGKSTSFVETLCAAISAMLLAEESS